MGYFLSVPKQRQEVDGMWFVAMQFEPLSSIQEDVTERVRSEFKTLYHWSPKYNKSNILNNGLVPKNENDGFCYPPRIYFCTDNGEENRLISFGEELCFSNGDARNGGDYCLFGVDTGLLGKHVRFYFDAMSPLGVYTENVVPKESIFVVGEFKFPVKPQR